ncbi:Gag-Pol polyprotein [Lentinula edodes]|uniref:Gag-Pol polyprotein n=1 Tax=Lentinula edodes TaxID=5353 RepID=A0A1Q3DW67_LENED|nr:Gag-Pol polyprotein [Lentinula edodes]
MTFEEGRAHRTREATETEDANNEVVGGEVAGTTGLEIGKPSEDPATTSDDTGPIQQQETHDPDTRPQPNQMGVENLQPATRHSTRGHVPSRRYLESAEYTEREEAARSGGADWSTDTPMAGHTFALITQSPYSFAATSGELWVPQSYKQAIKYPDLWREPMQREIDTLKDKECWELVPLPPDTNLTGGRWTYAIKFDANGKLLKRKARYVAQGYTQVQGQDYDKTYGGVARMESVRLVLAIVAVLRLSIFQVDFTAAFLNSPITHDVYLKQPEGFVRPGTEHLVCKLKKSIYGTMQGSHDWQETLAAGYTADGYITSRADPCIRYRRVRNEYTITSTYGDDVCGGSSTVAGRDRAVGDLGKRWEANKVTSQVLLGMTIHQDPESKAVTISQKAYFQRMLTHFGLDKVRCRVTPLPPNVKLHASPNPLPEQEQRFMQDKPY